MKRTNAFTLAEVLITLTIIGVIAALTIPTLLQKHQEQVTITKVKKINNILSNAYKQLIIEEGPVSSWLENKNYTNAERGEIIASNFKKHLKIAKDCGYEKNLCFKNITAKNLSGTDYTHNYDNLNNTCPKVLLDDGIALQFCGSGSSWSITNDYSIVVDIDGIQGPTTLGKDIFFFWITDDNIEARSLPEGSHPEDINKTCSFNTTNSGYGCAGWIILKGNMDYLRKNISWN